MEQVLARIEEIKAETLNWPEGPQLAITMFPQDRPVAMVVSATLRVDPLEYTFQQPISYSSIQNNTWEPAVQNLFLSVGAVLLDRGYENVFRREVRGCPVLSEE